LVAAYGPERGREAAAEGLAFAWEHWGELRTTNNPIGYLCVEMVRRSKDRRMKGGTMSKFEVSARMKVRRGQVEGFKDQAAEVIRLTREKDTRTLRYDWFLSDDETECEIREAYVDADGFLEHRANVDEALNKLFTEFADAHNVTVYGEPSKKLVDFAAAQMPPGSVRWYQFLDGIGAAPTVTP